MLNIMPDLRLSKRSIHFIHGLVIICLWSLLSFKAFANDDMLNLLDSVKHRQQALSAVYKAREQRFLQDKNKQAALLAEAKQAFVAAQRENNPLVKASEEKQQKIENLRSTLEGLKQDLGNIDQRYLQFAGDFSSQLQNSIVQTQLMDRQGALDNLLAQDELTQLDQLRKLWYLVLEEMREAGRVVSYASPVVQLDGQVKSETVLRLGSFSLMREDQQAYLQYLPQTQELLSINRLPYQYQVQAGASIAALEAGEGFLSVDPTRGVQLQYLDQMPSLSERILQGKEVGFMIIGLALSGLLFAFYRASALLIARRNIQKQLQDLGQAKANNALGRILIAAQAVYKTELETKEEFTENNKVNSTEHIQLALDEAILKELPKLERGLGLLKLLAAVAPLLGLLGTVIGMIATFQAISLFGSGDPKLMASGISQALITTVLGLLAAIPLLFLHNFLQGLSRSLVQLLDEQAAALLIQSQHPVSQSSMPSLEEGG